MLCKVKPYEGTEPYLFFSYCHKNAADVYPIIERMVSDGYRIWYDDGIHPGSDWLKVIAEHLSNSAGCIACITPESTCSHNCKSEINLCLELEKPLLAIKLKDFALTLATRLQLGAIQYVEKYQYAGDAAFYEKLYSADFLAGCKGQKPVPVVVEPPKNDRPIPAPQNDTDLDIQLAELKAKLDMLNDAYHEKIRQQVSLARNRAADQVETEKQAQLDKLQQQLLEKQKSQIEILSREIEDKYAAQLDAEKKAVALQCEQEVQQKRSEQEYQLRQEFDSVRNQRIQALDEKIEEQYAMAVSSAQASAAKESDASSRAALEKEKQKIEEEKAQKLEAARKNAEEKARMIWEEELAKLKHRVSELQQQMIHEAYQEIEHDAQEAWERIQEELSNANSKESETELARIMERLDKEQSEAKAQGMRDIAETCSLELQQNLKALDEKFAEEVEAAKIKRIEQINQRVEALRSQELSQIHNAAEADAYRIWEQQSEEIIRQMNRVSEQRMEQAAKDAEAQAGNAWRQEKQELEKQIESLQQRISLNDDGDRTVLARDFTGDIHKRDNAHGILVHPSSGRVYRLEAIETKIGRSAVSCDIVFAEDQGMSRHHATVICYQDKVYFKDAGSGNGTYINGMRMDSNTQIALESDTWIQMHNVELVYFAGSAAEQILATKRLSMLREAGKHTHIILDQEDLMLGRSREPQRGCFQDGKISRKHAVLSNRKDGMYIMDLSRNGTYINDIRIEAQVETPIANGAVLRMGDTVLECWNKQLTEGDEEV